MAFPRWSPISHSLVLRGGVLATTSLLLVAAAAALLALGWSSWAGPPAPAGWREVRGVVVSAQTMEVPGADTRYAPIIAYTVPAADENEGSSQLTFVGPADTTAPTPGEQVRTAYRVTDPQEARVLAPTHRLRGVLESLAALVLLAGAALAGSRTRGHRR